MSSAVHSPELHSRLRSELEERRSRLQSTITELHQPADLMGLLAEVDSALSRLEGPGFGSCAVCHEEVEADDLAANPMATYCLCRLTPERQRELERDLDLAWQVQAALLPPLGLSVAGWQTHYRYLPHGPVSGDYCDLVESDGNLYFMLGDVSGKGVAASLLMAHLNAALRGFARSGLSPQEALGEANRLLGESTLASHYATLVCGRANARGEVDIVNAGHCSPMIVRADGEVKPLETTGLPLGLALERSGGYAPERLVLDAGDTLFLYTDGLTDAVNREDADYGQQRLTQLLSGGAHKAPRDLISGCLSDLNSFRAGAPLEDDLTVLALRRQ